MSQRLIQCRESRRKWWFGIDGDTDRISYYWPLFLRLMRKYNESCCGNTGRNSQNFLNNRTWPYSAPMLVSRRTLAKDNWFCIARQCAVAGWLRRVHLPHRERSRHALHHPGRIESWRKKSQEGQAVSVFQSREPDVRQSRSRRKFNTIWTNPDLRCTKILEESTKIQYIGAIWSSLKEKDCSSIKTRSHAIAFFSTHFLRFVLRKWCAWGLKRIYTAKYTNPSGFRASYSRRICNLDVRIHPIPKREIRRPSKRTKREVRETCRSLLEDPRRKHPEESQRGKYRETCRGNVDYIIPGILSLNRPERRLESQGNRQKTDSTIRESPEQETR